LKGKRFINILSTIKTSESSRLLSQKIDKFINKRKASCNILHIHQMRKKIINFQAIISLKINQGDGG